jgi:hypothetical protein
LGLHNGGCYDLGTGTGTYTSLTACQTNCVDNTPGCTDSTAFNYNASATMDDGSCTYPVFGCTDPTATNYNALATIDDGSCVYPASGCTDPTATNYDATATTDDGSCIYSGCTDPTALNYNAAATVDDGSCNYPIGGCTDPCYANYNELATFDDGSCDVIRLCHIPDPNFRLALINHYNPAGVNTGGVLSVPLTFSPVGNLGITAASFVDQSGGINGPLEYIPVCNINFIASLYLYNSQITDLTGIGCFTALTWLDIGANAIPQSLLDLSQNTALAHLRCYGHILVSSPVTQNTSLISMHISGDYYNLFAPSSLISLDVSANTALTQLHCGNNQLTNLDVSQNTALTKLWCYSNQLTSLDVSQNKALTFLECAGNQLTSLDVSQNDALTYLRCSGNQLTILDLRNGNNTNFYGGNENGIQANSNSSLACISVDNAVWSTANWTYPLYFQFDSQQYFSNSC